MEGYRRFLPIPDFACLESDLTSAPGQAQEGRATSDLPPGLPPSLLQCHHDVVDDSVREISRADPFFALHRFFSFYIASEAQYLTFLDEQGRKDARPEPEESNIMDSRSLASLLNNQRTLEDHIHQLEYVLGLIKVRGSEDWPRSPSITAITAAKKLRRDIVYLLHRAKGIRLRSERSITMSMGVASIEEARRGIRQNENVFKFTVIAAIYIPLSFTASFFGMNFREFGQGHKSIWIYFAASVPLFLVSGVFLYYGPVGLGTLKKVLQKAAVYL